jgi:hypothetical protein
MVDMEVLRGGLGAGCGSSVTCIDEVNDDDDDNESTHV